MLLAQRPQASVGELARAHEVRGDAENILKEWQSSLGRSDEVNI
jgi:hypothetical protein